MCKNIIFASWDAEEYGLVGSTAFAESIGDRNDQSKHFIMYT